MELKEKVKQLLAEIDKTHRYSTGRIYGLYNEAFSLSETPQACASCLIRRVNELKKWLWLQTEATDPALREEVSDQKMPAKKRGGRTKKD